MLEVCDVVKTFRDDAGELPVLSGVRFSLAGGDLAALLGISGAGKTTLLQILGGLDLPTSGEVRVGGRSLGEMNAVEMARFRSASIGFVFQFHHLLPDFSALDNTLMPGLIAGKRRCDCTARARELLDAVGLGRRTGHYPGQMSGGERQRVALARALFNNPAFVLADEPTGNLDRRNGELLAQLFVEANRRFGQTFLIATHNEHLASCMHRVLVLEDGKIAQDAAAPCGDGSTKAP